MRLLQRSEDGTFSLTEECFQDIPPYAILSHRWYKAAEEVTFADIMNGTGREKRGYSKLMLCADYAASKGLQYLWVDTCCIDKTNSVELQEAINSMFRWYRRAARCYVYMSDVICEDLHEVVSLGRINEFFIRASCILGSPGQIFDGDCVSDAFLERMIDLVPGGKYGLFADPLKSFRESEWFRRGWTLQELIAPSSVEFFDQRGKFIGDKTSLLQELVAITGIPECALSGVPLKNFTVRSRLTWANRRITTREEDEAYCLLGIVGVYMPLLYGEGLENARRRLDREIALSQSFFEIAYACAYRFTYEMYPRQLVEKIIPFVLTMDRSALSSDTLHEGFFTFYMSTVYGVSILCISVASIVLLYLAFVGRHYVFEFVQSASITLALLSLSLLLIFSRTECFLVASAVLQIGYRVYIGWTQ